MCILKISKEESMKLQKLGILALTLALALIVAACNGDDDIVGDVPDIEDDDTEQVDEPPTVADDAPADDAAEEYVEDENDAVTDDEDAAVVDDEDDAVMGDHESADVTITDEGIQIVLPDADANMTEEDDAVMDDQDEATTEEEEHDTEAAGDEAAIDQGEEEELLDDQVTFSSGEIFFNVTNDWDTEVGLAIIPGDADANGAELQELDRTLGEGDSTEWGVNLEPGDYVMYVLVDGERDMDMQVPFSVNGNDEMNGVDEADDAEEENTDPANDEENDEPVEDDNEADDE
jgi:hypothetical protein